MDLQELVGPAHTALCIVECQNGVVGPESSMAAVADAVAKAMAAGIKAITDLGPEKGALRIGAGNYGGNLGPHHFHLKDLLP